MEPKLVSPFATMIQETSKLDEDGNRVVTAKLATYEPVAPFAPFLGKDVSVQADGSRMLAFVEKVLAVAEQDKEGQIRIRTDITLSRQDGLERFLARRLSMTMAQEELPLAKSK